MQRLGRRAARGHGEASRGADVRLLIFEAHLTGERGEVGHQLLILEAARRRRGRVRLRICLWFRFRLWLMLGIWRLRLGRAPQGGVQPAVDVDVEQRPLRRRRDRIVERFASSLWRFEPLHRSRASQIGGCCTRQPAPPPGSRRDVAHGVVGDGGEGGPLWSNSDHVFGGEASRWSNSGCNAPRTALRTGRGTSRERSI